ncbi:MAG: Lrp/AsnC family transcriptional regulator [Lentisphaerae bacterium]|nr:Lrp/AsnC family transcriptional regulator [Lentisphaerota bacterium]
MDETDRKILNILKNNSRTSNQEIARQINLAPSAALKRLRRLEDSGIITGYTTRIAHNNIDLSMNVLISVVTSESAGAIAIGKKLAALPEICDVFDVAGNISYIVRAVVKDTENLNQLIIKMGQIPGVMRTQTTLIMNVLKNELAVEL